MTGFFQLTSNRLVALADMLGKALRDPVPPDPFSGETVIVQSRGMARWLSLQIAERAGICMNFSFPFPRAFVFRVLREFLPSTASLPELTPAWMTWKIFGALPDLARREGFEEIRNYIGDGNPLKTIQIAGRIAAAFDQYLIYRSEIVASWADSGDHWQAVLWRELFAGERFSHPGLLIEELLRSIRQSGTGGSIARRISIFGIPALPPLYLRIFHALASGRTVNLFSLVPCREYIGHDISPKLAAKRRVRSPEVRGDISVGHPLLTSLGRLHRDAMEVLLEIDEREGHSTTDAGEVFQDPGSNSLLHALQSDILHARCRGSGDWPRLPVSPEDDSVTLHCCHSPLREVEVLQDQILEFFQRDPSLMPRDILVMAPEIEKYAPFIDAVFGNPEDANKRIPFSVSDRRPPEGHAISETFASLMGIPSGRFTASEIFSFLERSPIRQRFEFSDDDLEIIRTWVESTGIRWGIDARHRQRLGLPETDDNSWRAGLRQLLLGYAMRDNGHEIFEGIAPCDDVEGSQAVLAGRLLTAVESLMTWHESAARPRTLPEWQALVDGLLDTFFPNESAEDAAALLEIRACLAALTEMAAKAGVAELPVDFTVFRHELLRAIDHTERRGGFLTGGVTFCALQPMRSIPSRVICLLGMNDGAFPRSPTLSGFDLISRKPLPGDRSVRDEDRYTFLEALMAAEERLLIFYSGLSITDNTESPPSVVVCELVDCINSSFSFPESPGNGRFSSITHRQHAFSPAYFDGHSTNLFSFSESNARVSRALLEPPLLADPDFLRDPLPSLPVESRDLTLHSLTRFFRGPAEFFLRHRIGLYLDDNLPSLPDAEPFELGSLDAYSIRSRLLSIHDDDPPPDVNYFVSKGLLPPGASGPLIFNDLRREVERFSGSVKEALGGRNWCAPSHFDVVIGDFRLTGSLSALTDGGLAFCRCAAIQPKDILTAWISHLVACHLVPDCSLATILIGSDSMISLSRVQDATSTLEGLLELYREGMQTPLPFFPQASWEFAFAKLRPSQKAKTTPIEKASKAWSSPNGEAAQPAHTLCFSRGNPLDGRFEELALRIFGPILEVMAP
ncbi:MAG: exodeoxyribonuclease V subunit gamma [Terrimicrobiaceae bacterium]